MSVMRSILLAGSQSVWLRRHAPRFPFVRRGVSRFMPGETADAALAAAGKLQQDGIGTVFTLLGENITERAEAERVADHYVDVLQRIAALALPTEVSVKLTQLGLDLSPEFCYQNVQKIIEAAGPKSCLWIDIEASNYTDITLDIYRRAKAAYPNVGVCLQAYLYRTEKDLASLLPMGGAIRLVKGAYAEPPDKAFPNKSDVDENYFKLATEMISDEARRVGLRAAMATHDVNLIRRIQQYALSKGLGKDALEFQMLYGIQRAEQYRLVREGWKSIVLIGYGSYWFPWFMRRLAERPANVLFLVKNIFG